MTFTVSFWRDVPVSQKPLCKLKYVVVFTSFASLSFVLLYISQPPDIFAVGTETGEQEEISGSDGFRSDQSRENETVKQTQVLTNTFPNNTFVENLVVGWKWETHSSLAGGSCVVDPICVFFLNLQILRLCVAGFLQKTTVMFHTFLVLGHLIIHHTA